MRDVYVLATACTAFGKRPGDSFKALTREVYLDLLKDAGWENGDAIEQGWFGNCGMGTFGQRNIRGQVCFTPLVREGLFPERVGLINVEGGCATASMAFHGAWKDVASGDMEVSLAIGVEKTFVPGDPDRTLEIFEGGIDQLDASEWHEYYKRRGEESGKPFDPNGGGGTVAIAVLGKLGYEVIASTGRTEEADFLKSLGASEVIHRDELSGPAKPLGKERWAGAIDAVGSHTLANVLSMTSYGGAVTACGLAQGMDLPTSVAPFILRGVSLLGIDSVMAPLALRQEAWSRLSADLDMGKLDALSTEIGFDGIIDAAHAIIDGKIRGRVVVDMKSANA